MLVALLCVVAAAIPAPFSTTVSTCGFLATHVRVRSSLLVGYRCYTTDSALSAAHNAECTVCGPEITLWIGPNASIERLVMDDSQIRVSSLFASLYRAMGDEVDQFGLGDPNYNKAGDPETGDPFDDDANRNKAPMGAKADQIGDLDEAYDEVLAAADEAARDGR